jgi:hypothetical protein
MTDTRNREPAVLDAEVAELPPAPFLPEFTTEEELRDFWDTHSSASVWNQMEDVTDNPPPGLRQRPPGVPSTARKRPPEGRMDLVSIRLPAELIDGVKAVAARRHLPYQTLMRSWIAERLEIEQDARPPSNTGD